jgi:hypothetical protein
MDENLSNISWPELLEWSERLPVKENTMGSCSRSRLSILQPVFVISVTLSSNVLDMKKGLVKIHFQSPQNFEVRKSPSHPSHLRMFVIEKKIQTDFISINRSSHFAFCLAIGSLETLLFG